MAKNLKLNVKNAQLAEVLKLSKPKKPAVKKQAEPVEPTSSPAEGEAAVKEKKKKAPAKTKTAKKEEATPPPREEPVVAAPQPLVEQAPPPAPSIIREEVAPPPAQEKSLPPPPQKATPPQRPAPFSRPPQGDFREQRSNYSSPRPPQGDFREQRPHYSSSRPPQGDFREQRSGYSSPRPPQGDFREQRPHYTSSRPPYGQQGGPSTGYPQRRPPYPSSGQYRPAGGGGNYPPRPGGPFRPGGAQPSSYPPRRPGFTPHPGGGRPPYPPRPRPPGAGPFRPGMGRPPTMPRGPVLPEETKGGERKRTFDTEPRKPTQKEFREYKPSKKLEERSFDARDRQGLRDTDDEAWRKRRPSHKMKYISQEEAVIRPKSLHVRIPITIKDLAAEMKLKASQLISKLFMKGIVATINDFLDDETTIQLLGHDFECEITIDRAEEDRLRITDKTIKQEIAETAVDDLLLRSPVVTFMGHVDHGKTSLIDAIRTSEIAAGEAGAITQHIGAFKCHTPAGAITILDTPGHEAFSAMRARGADVTDIVVLVIAGDEGMRTQTIEALEQAKAAHVPIVVAINKCDKPNFNPENVFRELADHELLPEAWGGQTITINCSAVTKQGLPQLLEMLALQAEILELKANPNCRARGTVIESEMHKGLGAVATILVQNGTLRLGDALVFSHEFAKIKTMHDEHDTELTEAGPSTPVKITGLSGLPAAGSEFIVVKNEKEAMEIAEKRSEGHRHTLLHQAKKGLDSFLAEKASTAKKKTLNIILRADVQGSAEALKNSLTKIASDKVDLNILSSGVGEISESDVQLASASKAIILGFHTKIESHAESLIKSLKVTVRLHDIIYHAVDDIKAQMLTLLDKVAQENTIGSAEVKAVFKASQLGLIAGCMVTDGLIKRSSHIRQIRDKQQIWKGPIQSLKKVKEDVREASKGQECGILLANHTDIKVGDILEAFEITYLQQEL